MKLLLVGLSLLVSGLFLPSSGFSAFEDMEVGARPLGMGSAFVAIADDANGIYWNPAGIGRITGSQLTAFYSQPFGLKELSFGVVGYVHRLPWGCFGLGYETFGNRLYEEKTYLLSYGQALEKRISIGANLRVMRLWIEGYGSDTAFGLDFGLLAKLGKGLNWGIFTRNLNTPRIGRAKEKLPQSLTAGLSFRPVEGLIIGCDVYKDIRFPSQVRVGQEYRVLPYLTLRMGVVTNPSRFAAGFGLDLKMFKIDYAFFTHRALGASHQTSLTINFGKERWSSIRFQDDQMRSRVGSPEGAYPSCFRTPVSLTDPYLPSRFQSLWTQAPGRCGR